MCRMRSIRETARIFKKMDPDTQITEKTIRNMISAGSIPVFKTGNKYLINVDSLLEMFRAPVVGMCKVIGANENLSAVEK